jgi:hypothetical protein
LSSRLPKLVKPWSKPCQKNKTSLEAGFKFIFKIVIEIFQTPQHVNLFGGFVCIIVFVKHLNKQVAQHVNVNLAAVFSAGSQRDTFFP